MNIEEFESLSDKEKEEFLGKGKQFDRIRRVTGYLNPDSRQWNDGKQEEVGSASYSDIISGDDRISIYFQNDTGVDRHVKPESA